jgi:hypothetical protein
VALPPWRQGGAFGRLAADRGSGAPRRFADHVRPRRLLPRPARLGVPHPGAPPQPFPLGGLLRDPRPGERPLVRLPRPAGPLQPDPQPAPGPARRRHGRYGGLADPGLAGVRRAAAALAARVGRGLRRHRRGAVPPLDAASAAAVARARGAGARGAGFAGPAPSRGRPLRARPARGLDPPRARVAAAARGRGLRGSPPASGLAVRSGHRAGNPRGVRAATAACGRPAPRVDPAGALPRGEGAWPRATVRP